MGGVTQHVIFYPRQEIFWRYQVFHHKINLFKVTRHFLCFISNLVQLNWTNALKYCYYHPTPWEDLKSYLPFDMTNFNFFWFYYKAHKLCMMRNHTRYKAKQLPIVYFQKYTMCHAVFCHFSVQETRAQTRLIFTVFIVWWPWKLGNGHQNLINSFNYPNDTIHKVWLEPIIWFKKQGADKLFLVKIWHSKCWCDLENEVKVIKT